MKRQAGVTLRAALSWAVRMNLAANNPAKLVKMPAHRKAKVKALEPDQIAAFLLAASSDRLSAIYPLAIDSGCRQGELLALTWKDIDFGRGAVSVTKSLEEVEGRLSVKQPKTEKASRTIMLSAFSLDALQTHRKAMLAEGGYRPDGPVFCGPRDKGWIYKSDLYRHSFRPILRAAKLSFRFHDLRHCCATMLLMAGCDIKTVQERLGHSSPVLTLGTYAHVIEGSQGEAAKKLNAILENASRKQAEVS